MDLEELNRIDFEGHIKANFGCKTSEDGNISILSENEIKVLSFVPNMENDENKLKFDQTIIKCSNYHVADYTGMDLIDTVFNLPREKFYKMIMNEIYTPKFENTTIQVIRPLSMCWSAKGFHRQSDCALAVLSNSGNVEIFVKIAHQWICVINITECLVKELRWSETVIETKNVLIKGTIHEDRVLDCVASCISWSSISKNKKCIYMAIGYLNGCVRIWKLNCIEVYDIDKDNINPIIVTKLNIFTKRLCSIHWCQISEDKAWIICGDIDGQVKAVFITLQQNVNQTNKEITIWEYEDVRTSEILSFILKSHSFILIIKGQHLVISLLDNNNYSVIKTEIVNIGNLLITGIQQMNDDTFLISTFSGILKSLRIHINAADFKYEIGSVTTDLDFSQYCIKGLVKSPQGYLWGLLIFQCKIFDHLSIVKPTELVFCTDKNLDPGKVLKENVTQKLNNHWELLEIIRCFSLRKGTLPSNWILQCENFDDISLYELRIIYWLSLASYKLLYFQKKYVRFCDQISDPEILEKIIYFKFFLGRLHKHVEVLEKQEQFTEHDSNSLFMMLQFIISNRKEDYISEYFSGQFLEDVDKFIDKINIIKEVANIPTPKCYICDKSIEGSVCDHPDERCAVSHVQLNYDDTYWHCRYCSVIAHCLLPDPQPFCPICDIPLLPYDPAIQ